MWATEQWESRIEWWWSAPQLKAPCYRPAQKSIIKSRGMNSQAFQMRLLINKSKSHRQSARRILSSISYPSQQAFQKWETLRARFFTPTPRFSKAYRQASNKAHKRKFKWTVVRQTNLTPFHKKSLRSYHSTKFGPAWSQMRSICSTRSLMTHS